MHCRRPCDRGRFSMWKFGFLLFIRLGNRQQLPHRNEGRWHSPSLEKSSPSNAHQPIFIHIQKAHGLIQSGWNVPKTTLSDITLPGTQIWREFATYKLMPALTGITLIHRYVQLWPHWGVSWLHMILHICQL